MTRTSTSDSSVLPIGPDLAFLQHAVELHLHGDAHVADLVHEQSAAMGRLEQAAAIFVGAGEGAFHVAEQLGFEKGFGKRSAIDGDERVLWSARCFREWRGQPVPFPCRFRR